MTEYSNQGKKKLITTSHDEYSSGCLWAYTLKLKLSSWFLRSCWLYRSTYQIDLQILFRGGLMPLLYTYSNKWFTESLTLEYVSAVSVCPKSTCLAWNHAFILHKNRTGQPVSPSCFTLKSRKVVYVLSLNFFFFFFLLMELYLYFLVIHSSLCFGIDLSFRLLIPVVGNILHLQQYLNNQPLWTKISLL